VIDYKLLSFVKRSKRRVEIVKELSEPKTPTEIANALGVSVSHVSRTLREFDDRRLAVCKTPNAKIGRIYELTGEGRKILGKLA
jgi:predicted transcriptional regulator